MPTFVAAPADLLSAAARCLFLGNVDIVHLLRVTVVSGVREEHVKNHMTKRFMCDGKDRRRLFLEKEEDGQEKEDAQERHCPPLARNLDTNPV